MPPTPPGVHPVSTGSHKRRGVTSFPLATPLGTRQAPAEPGGGGKVTQLCPTLSTPLTVARQAPLSMGFSRQEYWSGLPFPPPGDLPDPGIEPVFLTSPALAGRFFTTVAKIWGREGQSLQLLHVCRPAGPRPPGSPGHGCGLCGSASHVPGTVGSCGLWRRDGRGQRQRPVQISDEAGLRASHLFYCSQIQQSTSLLGLPVPSLPRSPLSQPPQAPPDSLPTLHSWTVWPDRLAFPWAGFQG